MAQRVDYEWVVEEMDGEEIADCFYYAQLDQALAHRAQLVADGKAVDFGLCRHLVEGHGENEDEIGRSYAYCNAQGVLARVTDDGSHIPARFPHTPLRAA